MTLTSVREEYPGRVPEQGASSFRFAPVEGSGKSLGTFFNILKNIFQIFKHLTLDEFVT